MKLVAEVVGMGPERTLDGAIYLIDPVDPSSVFPEATALKRQCVIHGKPFISTVATARDWIEVERIHAGLAADAGADDLHAFQGQTLALIAHDAMKPAMLAFADEHFDVLARFGQRGDGHHRPALERAGLEPGLAQRYAVGDALPERPDGRRCADCRPGAGGAASARSSSRTRMWRASTRPISSCWSAR
jgi:methylglyoxal synthase